jgi:hypothetical protein
MTRVIKLGCVLLLACAPIGPAVAGELDVARLLRGIYLTNATIGSTSPAILKLGQLEIPATDLHLVANVSIQTSCHFFWGTWTNRIVRFTVRIGEDPYRRACYELAREMCERWKDAQRLADEERGYLAQVDMVFQNGANYSLLIEPADVPQADNYLWFDGRIIQEPGTWGGYFHGGLAKFAINGVPRELRQESLSPRKIIRLFKRGAFGHGP